MPYTTAKFTPPKLPGYLSATYSLRTIQGIPSDEDVKAIHAVIRAAKIAEQIPALNDPILAIQLDQHLFNVQMAVYRNTYPSSLFPGDAIYTPPNLPSHLRIALEPVIGSPSDGQIMMARNAARELEKLSEIPSMSNPELSMKLSQHLFNIQLGMLDFEFAQSASDEAKSRWVARHIQELGQGRFSLEPSQSDSGAGGPAAASRRRVVPDLGDGHDEAGHVSSNEQGIEKDPTRPDTTEPQQGDRSIGTVGLSEIAGSGKTSSEDTNRLLYDLRNVCVTLIGYQIRVLQGPTYEGIPMINLKGEVPVRCGLPPLGFPDLGSMDDIPNDDHVRLTNGERITDAQIAAYLRFYEIGTELIANHHGEPTLAPGREAEAEQLLIKHVYEDPGSGWVVSS